MWTPAITLPSFLTGLRVDKFDTFRLVIEPGVFASASGLDVYTVTENLFVDISSYGPGGRDTITNFVNGDEVYVYFFKNNSTGEVRGVISRARFYGDVGQFTNWTMLRKHDRFSLIYNTNRSGGSGGIPDFHMGVTPGFINLTNFETSNSWSGIQNGHSTNWADIDLSGIVPDNARLASLLCITRYGSRAGSSFIRSTGNQVYGRLVGEVSPTIGVDSIADISAFRLTSTRRMQYYVNTPEVGFDVYCTGYYITEITT